MIIQKELHAQNGERVVLLRISGLIVLDRSSPVLLETIELLPEKNVILDLSCIDYVDSTGVGEMVGMWGRIAKSGRKMVLLKAPERIMKLLQLTQLSKIFLAFGDEKEALASFEK